MFEHFNDAKIVGDDEINELLKKVHQKLFKGEGYICFSTGETVVIGGEYGNEFEFRVCNSSGVSVARFPIRAPFKTPVYKRPIRDDSFVENILYNVFLQGVGKADKRFQERLHKILLKLRDRINAQRLPETDSSDSETCSETL